MMTTGMRQEQAVRLTLAARKDSIVGSRGTEQDSSVSQDGGGNATELSDKLKDLLTQYLKPLLGSFPRDTVERLLSASGDSGKSEKLETALSEWLGAERKRVEKALAAALGAIAVTACMAVFAGWQERLGLDLKPSLELLAQLRNWAKIQADRILDEINARISTDLARLIAAGSDDGLSSEQITSIATTCLEEQMGRIEETAATRAQRALNEGKYQANISLGADAKSWRTRGDEGVCKCCQANEAEGGIPIGQPFSSGDQYPPAHAWCRCWLEYAGVTRKSALGTM